MSLATTRMGVIRETHVSKGSWGYVVMVTHIEMS